MWETNSVIKSLVIKMENSLAMIELPELVILLICKHLSYRDLRSLKMTCKKLKEIVDQRTPRSLHLFVDSRPVERKLFFTGESVSYANTLYARRVSIFRRTEFKNHFSRLLKLTIFYDLNCFESLYNVSKTPYFYFFKTVELNDLNCFESLLHLEIGELVIKYGRLSLRNLTILHFENATRCDSYFQLDCPRLQALCLGYEASFRQTPWLTPETGKSIRHLHIKDAEVSRTYYWPLFYGKLQNLSTICFEYGEVLNDFVLAMIERRVSLPTLKEIRLKYMCYFAERGVLFRNLSELKSRPETQHIDIKINWTLMGRDELAEMFNVIRKIVPDNTEDLFFFNRFDESVVLGSLKGALFKHFEENPILHCILPGVRILRIQCNEDVRPSRRLIGKLRNLFRLSIGTGVELDENFFECIRKTSLKILDLQIGRAYLKQRQLDQMANYLQNLRSLAFYDDFCLDDYSFDFVAKFKKLATIQLCYNIRQETMSALLKNCKNLPNFQNLELKGEQKIWIVAQPNKNEIICGSESACIHQLRSKKRTKFASIEDAIDHYYQNDLFNTPFVRN